MKYKLLMITCTFIASCSAHLPTTQSDALGDTRVAIQKARDAGAEQCAPEALAKAEVAQLYAAHELDEGSSYNSDEAEVLIDDALASAKQAIMMCGASKTTVKPKPVATPKPKVVLKPRLEVITLDGVFFESNSAKLTSSSMVILDKAVVALSKQPHAHVEVGAHTDSGGKASYNEYLSSLRANTVMDYLVSHGINASRLTAKGYGEAYPIADNASKAGKAKNRRVELKIIR